MILLNCCFVIFEVFFRRCKKINLNTEKFRSKWSKVFFCGWNFPHYTSAARILLISLTLDKDRVGSLLTDEWSYVGRTILHESWYSNYSYCKLRYRIVAFVALEIKTSDSFQSFVIWALKMLAKSNFKCAEPAQIHYKSLWTISPPTDTF